MLPLNVPLSQVSDPQEGVLLLVDKPLTWTSFDVVNKIRYYLKKELKTGKIKVGHAGTLDPSATGLLIICIGKYTKRIEEIQTQNKEYKGTMILGSTTPSYDLETEADNTFPISDLHEEELLKTVLKFEGEIEQIPPAYSAVKVDGVRAYKKARDNQSIKLKSRTVNIETFKIDKIEMPSVKFTIACSTGTYIRSLVHDFGRELNNGAHLTSLMRTRIGEFSLDDAWKLEEVLT